MTPDFCWTIIPCRGDSGDAYQARALGRVPGRPGLCDTRGLGALRYVADLGDDGARRAAEADGWRSGLACDPGYAPLTRRPAAAQPTVPVAPADLAAIAAPPAPPLAAVLDEVASALVAVVAASGHSARARDDHGAGPAAPRTRRAPARSRAKKGR